MEHIKGTDQIVDPLTKIVGPKGHWDKMTAMVGVHPNVEEARFRAFCFERSHRLNYIKCKITGYTQCRLATAILSSRVGEQTARGSFNFQTGGGKV